MNKILTRDDLEKLPRIRREQLLAKIDSDPRLPSLGTAISEVIKITSTGEESVNKLAKFILSDVSLTRDILNLANSASYRHSQGANVTTISKAIFILGFDMVKSSALSMLMLECFNPQFQSLYYELTRSLCASIVARECVHRSMHPDSEEATISALFKNIGELMIAALDRDLYDVIMLPVRNNQLSMHDSATAQIGCSLPHFGALVLQHWNMPDSIVQATLALTQSPLKKAKHRSEWVRQVASFSADAAEVVLRNVQLVKDDGQNAEFDQESFAYALIQRYGVALELDPHILPNWLSRAVAETEAMVKHMGMRIAQAPDGSLPLAPAGLLPGIQLQEFQRASETGEEISALDEILMVSSTTRTTIEQARYPSGKSHACRELLLAGLMEMTQTIASGKYQLNNLVLQMLEILHSALGFQFVTAGLKDGKADEYVARISLGQNWHAKQKRFSFPAWDGADLFHLALKNNADLMISDTSGKKIQQLLPRWHLTHFPEVRSLMILPLIVQGKPIGLIYADRDCVAPEGVPPDETSLIKAMKDQLIVAMSK